MIILNLLYIIILITLNAFFVAVEYAAVASRRTKLETIIKKETSASKTVREWLENPSKRDKLIAADQVAITLINLAIGAISENTFSAIFTPVISKIQLTAQFGFLAGFLQALPWVLALIVATSLQVVFGELIPKVAVLRSPEKFALIAAPWVRVFIAVFLPFINVLEWTAKQVLAGIGLSQNSQDTSMSLEEMKVMIDGPDMAKVIDKPERDMLSAVIEFGALVVRQVSIPRTEIVAVEADASLDEVITVVSNSHRSKLPVYEDNLDHVIGVIHVQDIMQSINNGSQNEITARSIMREALFVPETISVNDLLHQFRSSRQHMAIVLDEYGGTAGLVTLEDLVEEIVGDYRDSFESTLPAIQSVSMGKALVDGLTLIIDINDHFHLNLHDPNYDTLAGYILGRLTRIPVIGDKVEDPQSGTIFQVERMDGLRVSQVMIINPGNSD